VWPQHVPKVFEISKPFEHSFMTIYGICLSTILKLC